MRLTGKTIRGCLAAALVAMVAGGCIAFGYDFDKKPPAVCAVAADCPGEDTACGTRACLEGACIFKDTLTKGTKPLDQPKGDCKVIECDGAGIALVKADDEDKPLSGNECSVGVCDQGTPSIEFVANGAACGTVDGLTCDGAGTCMGCTEASHCGADGDCFNWVCDDMGKCQKAIPSIGKLVKNPLLGDCKAEVCGANGEVVTGPYLSDKPNDANDCTADDCDPEGNPTFTNLPAGTSCPGDCRSCSNGKCIDGCVTGYVCEGTTCAADIKLPNGSPCAADDDCLSVHCVDKVCCDTACNGFCQACSAAKTGAADGTCSPVANGTDPDDECSSPANDVCVGGKCQCYNEVRDGTEELADCGGNCNPCPAKWNCNNGSGCLTSARCCSSFDCSQCKNNPPADDCGAYHGKGCEPGSPDKILGSVGWALSCLGDACKGMVCKCQ